MKILWVSTRTDLTGEGIAKKILDFVRNLGLDMTYMVGQGYDGASSMSGKFYGTQAIIRQNFRTPFTFTVRVML